MTLELPGGNFPFSVLCLQGMPNPGQKFGLILEFFQGKAPKVGGGGGKGGGVCERGCKYEWERRFEGMLEVLEGSFGGMEEVSTGFVVRSINCWLSLRGFDGGDFL